MEFEVENQPCFEIPLQNVNHCTTAKNEVAVEFHQNDECAVSLMEMRFHIPTTDTNQMEDRVEVRPCPAFNLRTYLRELWEGFFRLVYFETLLLTQIVRQNFFSNFVKESCNTQVSFRKPERLLPFWMKFYVPLPGN